MIRTRRVELPRGSFAWARRFSKTVEHGAGGWVQRDVENEALRQRFIDLCGYVGSKKPDVLAHLIGECIPWHSDGWAKSCFLIPILSRPSVTLEVDSDDTGRRAVRSLARGNVYRFNDHSEHRLRNENRARVVLVTVSFSDR